MLLQSNHSPLLARGAGGEAFNIPRHIEKQFQVVGSHLRVVDVGNPQTATVVVVGSTHLGVDQSWLRRRQPQVVMGTPPVAEVVVDASPTLPLLLFGI